MEKHKALSQEHYSKMDALEEAYQVKHISGLLPVIKVMDWTWSIYAAWDFLISHSINQRAS